MCAARILIVEDEALVAIAAADVLEACGYEVVGTAISHEEAVTFATAAVPDLVLMDIRLKGTVDGVETARLLRARYGCRVIFVTGQSDRTTRERANALEPEGYLTKPFTPAQLEDVVAKAFAPGSN